MGTKDGFAEICRREMGLSWPRCFARQFAASEVFVKRLDLYGKLNGHEGCVNTVEFNSSGDLLVSGSDDRKVMFWDWETKSKRLLYHPGHTSNIFQAKFMPFTDDRTIITSAEDGQIRLGQVLDDGQVNTLSLGKHQGRVYKLAVEPGSSHVLYSCGEDGFIQHFDLRSHSATKLFCCTELINKQRFKRIIPLNTVVIDPRNPHYLAVGGEDEFARLYDIRRCSQNPSSKSEEPVNTFCPRHLINVNNIHITGLAYSYTSELLVTYSDEHIYLFQKNMGLGITPHSALLEDAEELEEPQVYQGHKNRQTIKGVNFFGPNDDYVLSGSDCGHIFFWRKKGAKLVRLMKGDRRTVNHLEPHPHMPFLATCGIENDIKLWAPMNTDVPPLPGNADKILESNRPDGDDESRLILTPGVIRHFSRLQTRQTTQYVERPYSRADIESDEENAEPSVLGLSYVNAPSENNQEDLAQSPSDCNVS